MSLLLLCAANRPAVTTVCAVQWVDTTRVEAQVATVAPIVRTGNPKEAVRRHVVQRTGIVVAIAAGREENGVAFFILFGIEMPSLIKYSLYIELVRIICIITCRGEPRESIGCRKRISYGAGVIHTLYHHLIISISPIIIRTPQIIVLSFHLTLGVESMS